MKIKKGALLELEGKYYIIASTTKHEVELENAETGEISKRIVSPSVVYEAV